MHVRLVTVESNTTLPPPATKLSSSVVRLTMLLVVILCHRAHGACTQWLFERESERATYLPSFCFVICNNKKRTILSDVFSKTILYTQGPNPLTGRRQYLLVEENAEEISVLETYKSVLACRSTNRIRSFNRGCNSTNNDALSHVKTLQLANLFWVKLNCYS
jgi:hypothetical protein